MSYNRDLLNPDVTILARCKYCKQLFRPDLEKIADEAGDLDPVKLEEAVQECSHCGVRLDFQTEIIPAAIEYVLTTKAVASANSLLMIDYSALLHVGLVVFQLLNSRVSIFGFLALGPLFAIFGWFVRYGKLATDDADYNDVIKRLRLSRWLWIALSILNIVAVIFITRG